MDPETIWHAIIEQESGGNGPNPGQIQPQTFAQYARPGENINNPVDNVVVSKRIINDYFKRYNGDVGRIATAYFSGPGNVSATGIQPFLRNANDGTKTTASYVSDIQRRVAKMAQPSNFDADAAFSQFEQSAPKAVENFDPKTAFSQWEAKPSTVPTVASNIPVAPENMTPAQLQEYKASLQRGKEGPSSFFSQFHPLQSIESTVSGGMQQFQQGVKDIGTGNVATGVGNVAMGGLNAVLGPVAGPYNETLRFGGTLIGNPQAADVASLVLPTRGITAGAMAVLPEARAAKGIIDLVGKENIPAILKRMEANPNLSLMDVSEPVKTVASGLANNPETPAAQSLMRGAFDARTSARQDIVQQSIDRTLGPPINVKDYLDQLKANVSAVGKQRIEPALEGAQPVGVMPLVDRLDQVIKNPGTSDETISRLTKLKNQITAEAGKDGFIDPEKLHGIQWRLRAEAENLAQSASGADRNLAGPLFEARNDMVSAIDNASGGKYKPALSGYRDESNVQDAFGKGFSIFKNGGVEDFPEFWRDWASNAQPAELAAAKIGALTAIRRQIEGLQGGARRGENLLQPSFNIEKVATLFGPQQTARLASLLEDARSMSETNSLLFRNSKTAQVTAGQKYFQPREVGSPTGAAGGVGLGALGAMATAMGHPEAGLVGLGMGAAKGAHMGAQYIGRLADRSTATNFARLASASNGPTRNELISILRSVNASTGQKKLHNLIPSLVSLAAP